MLMPKRTKFRKMHRGRRRGRAGRGNSLVSQASSACRPPPWVGSTVARLRRPAAPLPTRSGGRVNSGSGSFRTNPSHKSQRRSAWVAARATSKAGSPLSSRGEFSSNSPGSKKPWLARPCVWRRTSSPYRLVLSLVQRRSPLGKADQFRNLSDDELTTRIAETKEELFRLRVQHATLQLADTSQLRLARRDNRSYADGSARTRVGSLRVGGGLTRARSACSPGRTRCQRSS